MNFSPSKKHIIGQFCGIVPITEYDREHGVMIPAPYTYITLDPPVQNFDHYIVSFLYKGVSYNTEGMGEQILDVQLDDRIFWRKFYPDESIVFSYTPCAVNACECRSNYRVYPYYRWDVRQKNWRLASALFKFNPIEEVHRKHYQCAWDVYKSGNLFNNGYPVQPQYIEWTLDHITTACTDFFNKCRLREIDDQFSRRQKAGERGPRNCLTRPDIRYYEAGCVFPRDSDGDIAEDLLRHFRKDYFATTSILQRGAESLALEIFEHTCNWPGWRYLAINYYGDTVEIFLLGGPLTAIPEPE